ncbi:unnamed protein product [marine sediment metagenome]|uniref:Uncharacterized protein n=1 Tax=marine sediment metagenome TaxID=412755 RepID=X1G4E1_9ZZZZ
MKEAKALNSLLEEARIAERKRHADAMAKMAKYEKESNERRKEANELLKGKLRQARVKDYKNWLAGFLKGFKPTHCYDYPMERGLDEWKVALSDFRIVPLFGTDSLNIIIPNGIKFLGGELGHSNLYFMDGFSHLGGWVPIYSDIHF